MDIKLTGRKALITGGSKGLGLAIARTFAEAGADVAIMARRQGPLDEAAAAIGSRQGQQVLPVICDVRRAEDIAAGFARVTQAFGRVDILVNNAGTSNAHPFETVTDAQWQEDIDLKLFAAIRLIRLVWPQMKEHKWGRVINVLNIGAKAPRPARVTEVGARGRHGADQGAGRRRRTARNSGQRAVGRLHRKRSMGPACREAGRAACGFSRQNGQGNSDGSRRHRAGIRQCGLLPGIGRGVLHHRHSHQCGRQPLAGGVDRASWAGSEPLYYFVISIEDRHGAFLSNDDDNG